MSNTLRPVFTRFNHLVSTELTNQIVTDLALRHIADVRELLREQAYDGSVQTYVSACLETFSAALNQGSIRDVALFEIDFSVFGACSEATGPSTALLLAHLQQVVAFFKKRKDIDVGVDKEQAAWKAFEESEVACRESNRIFRSREQGEIVFRPVVERVLSRASRKILQILGPEGPPSLNDVKVRFGKGATTRTPKRIASARRKLREGLTCGEGFLSAVQAAIWEIPGWYNHRFDDGSIDSALLTVYVDDGRLEFVPKNCKTHRAVTPSPNLDVMFQLGVGDYLTARLRQFGVDLSDQSLNKELARKGSLTGALATLDLSSASDTISIELVYSLLPVDWANFLWSFRTPTVRYKNEVLRLQKFSSMGNGYTFPLETLIFYALASVSVDEVECLDRTVSVYGDDIIVPIEAVPLLEEILFVTGFKLNKLKSFSTGHFRESCGGDYLWGIDVRPSFVKDRLHCSDLFVLHNSYVRRGLGRYASICRQWLDPRVELFGPDGYGDGHLLGDYTLDRPHRDRGWGVFSFQTYSRSPIWDFPDSPSEFEAAFPSYHVYSNSASCGLPDFRMPVEEMNWRYGRRAAFHNVALPSTRYKGEALGTVVPSAGRYRKTKIHIF